VGIGDRSGMVTDDSETFRLDNLESEEVGGVPASTPFGTRVLSWQ
jgi:hypothetical protein